MNAKWWNGALTVLGFINLGWIIRCLWTHEVTGIIVLCGVGTFIGMLWAATLLDAGDFK